MTADDRVWDAGLQPERTALAWRRLGLGLVGVGLALARVTYDGLGWWGIPGPLAGFTTATTPTVGWRFFRAIRASQEASVGRVPSRQPPHLADRAYSSSPPLYLSSR